MINKKRDDWSEEFDKMSNDWQLKELISHWLSQQKQELIDSFEKIIGENGLGKWEHNVWKISADERIRNLQREELREKLEKLRIKD